MVLERGASMLFGDMDSNVLLHLMLQLPRNASFVQPTSCTTVADMIHTGLAREARGADSHSTFIDLFKG